MFIISSSREREPHGGRIYRKEERTGLTLVPSPRLPKGGLRRNGGDPRG